MNYYYQAYGLNLESGFPCPELFPGEETTPDVSISYGEAPDSLPDARASGVCYQAAPGQFLLKVDGIANYLVSNGKEILVQPAPNANDDEVRLFLLGSPMGALLHQRGLLPLHGSAIEVNGKGVIFLGSSGTGKSTLAAAFHQRGYRVLADEISAVSIEDGVPMVVPGCPRLMLWPDAIRKLKMADSLGQVHLGLEKRRLPLGEGFCKEALPLHSFYILGATGISKLVLTSLTGRKKVMAIVCNTYHLQFVAGFNKGLSHFKLCSMIAKQATGHSIIRPLDPLFLAESVNLLEKDFRQ